MQSVNAWTAANCPTDAAALAVGEIGSRNTGKNGLLPVKGRRLITFAQ